MITGVLILTVEILIGPAVLGQEPQGQQTQSRPEPEEVERALERGRAKNPPIEPSEGGVTGRGDDLLATLTLLVEIKNALRNNVERHSFCPFSITKAAVRFRQSRIPSQTR